MANPVKIFLLVLSGLGLLFCILILMPATQALAWEVVTGRVSSMTKQGDKVQLTVLLDAPVAAKSTSTETQPQTAGRSISKSVSDNSANSIDLELKSNNLPPRLKPGDNIRIWKHPDNPQKTWRISFGRGHDPTGVRSRLCRCGNKPGRGSRRGGGKGGHGGH